MRFAAWRNRPWERFPNYFRLRFRRRTVPAAKVQRIKAHHVRAVCVCKIRCSLANEGAESFTRHEQRHVGVNLRLRQRMERRSRLCPYVCFVIRFLLPPGGPFKLDVEGSRMCLNVLRGNPGSFKGCCLCAPQMISTLCSFLGSLALRGHRLDRRQAVCKEPEGRHRHFPKHVGGIILSLR